MSKALIALTKKEKEIMELMWIKGRPLSRSEIIELSPERTWQASSIHILLNKLLDKGAIKVDGYVKTGKNFGRTFSSDVTQEEYQAMQFKQSAEYLKSKSSAITSFVSTLIDDEDIDEQTLDELEAIIQRRRNKGK